MGNASLATRNRTLQAMLTNDRVPFARAVAKALMNGPNATDWQKLASDAPDKWARAITELGKMAGFTEKQEVRHNVAVAVINMSDAAIMQRLAELQQQLATDAMPNPTQPGNDGNSNSARAPITIEHQPSPSDNSPATSDDSPQAA